MPYNLPLNDAEVNEKIVSYKKIANLPLSPAFAEKLYRLSIGQESHPSVLKPEGGHCEQHDNVFDREHPILITDSAKLIVGSVVVRGVQVFKLKTGDGTESFDNVFLTE